MLRIYFIVFALFTSVALNAADVIKTGEITADETWTADNTYYLNGFVFVKENATLSIEPGTVIKGFANANITSGDFTSALVITRGGKINAQGTATLPIIFTTELDDVTDAEDLDLTDEVQSRGLWGGVIILGKAPIGDESDEATIEGLPAGENSTYGGTAEDDNSGIMKYVSIRHGGAEIVTDEEINGLSLGGVGSGTTLENIEVAFNKDDGIEFFGGSVSVKWAIVSYCGDDSYDWDLGWRGNGQFWVSIGDTEAGDHAGEWDGCKPDDNARYANPNIYNFTFVGGFDGTNKGAAKNEHAIILRDGSAGTIANGIIAGFNNYALQIEETESAKHSFGYLGSGELAFLNNIWHDFGAGSSWDNVILSTPSTASANHLEDIKAHLSDNQNELAFSGVGVGRNGGPFLVPNKFSIAATKLAQEVPDTWFDDVDYIGAFEPGVNGDWANWTASAAYGLANFNINVGIKENINIATATIFPNPATNYATLSFTLENRDNINIKMVDVTGKVVVALRAAEYVAGVNQISINTASLKAGVYFIHMTAQNSNYTKRLIVE
ncbi:MAG: T9SS type A sorting domain-containing protein [Bacteroidia bacterium]